MRQYFRLKYTPLTLMVIQRILDIQQLGLVPRMIQLRGRCSKTWGMQAEA